MLVEMGKFLEDNGTINIEGNGKNFKVRKGRDGAYHIDHQSIPSFSGSLSAIEWVVQQIGGSSKVSNFGI